jgi:triacylglycerol esterase/lipase EstA (alpha/beta hydrolase family)
VALRLRDFVEGVFDACGGRGTIDLVAHSLGGLAARVYLQEYGGARRVDQCFTISTPHRGTYSSYWAPTTVGRQMRPGSDFLARLNDPSRRAPGVRFYSLWAGMDLMVLPRENSIYPEGDDACIRGAGHSGILIHPETMKLIARRLRAGQDVPSTRIERITQIGRGIFRKGLSAVTNKNRDP